MNGFDAGKIASIRSFIARGGKPLAEQKEVPAEDSFISTIRATCGSGFTDRFIETCNKNEKRFRDLAKRCEPEQFEAVHPLELAHFANNVVSKVREVRLVAPPGIGKTTKLPFELAKTWGGANQVILMEPTTLLARHHYENFSRSGKKVALDSGELDYRGVADGTVVVTTVGSLLRRFDAKEHKPPESAIVIHDEDHENDHATVVFKATWSDQKWIKRYVSMTATNPGGDDMAGERARNAKGLVKRFFRMPGEAEFVESCLSGDGNCPWSSLAMYGKRSLTFIEDEASAKALVAGLSTYMPAYRLNGTSTYEEIREAEKTLATAGKAGAAIIATSEFQSGFNLPVDVVYDVGWREFTVGKAGSTDLHTTRRRVTRDEARQRAERVGRSSDGLAFCPAEFTDGVSMLASGEIEHAMVLFYCLGYDPPKWLSERSSLTLDQLIGVDLDEFLRSRLPWVTWKARGGTDIYRRHHQSGQGNEVTIVDRGGENTRVPEAQIAIRVPDKREKAVDVLYWLKDIGYVDTRGVVEEHHLEVGGYFGLKDTGEVAINDAFCQRASVIDGSLLGWFKRKYHGNCVRGLCDYTSMERDEVCLVWLTLWNSNSASCVALLRICEENSILLRKVVLTEYGVTYRKLLQMRLEEVHEMYVLLKQCYARVFGGTKKRIVPVKDLVVWQNSEYDLLRPLRALENDERSKDTGQRAVHKFDRDGCAVIGSDYAMSNLAKAGVNMEKNFWKRVATWEPKARTWYAFKGFDN